MLYIVERYSLNYAINSAVDDISSCVNCILTWMTSHCRSSGPTPTRALECIELYTVAVYKLLVMNNWRAGQYNTCIRVGRLST